MIFLYLDITRRQKINLRHIKKWEAGFISTDPPRLVLKKDRTDLNLINYHSRSNIEKKTQTVFL